MLALEELREAFELIVDRLHPVDEPDREMLQARLLLLCVERLPNLDVLGELLDEIDPLTSTTPAATAAGRP